MLDDIISIGDRIELSAIVRNKMDDSAAKTPPKIYRSAVRDVISNDQVEILMPLEHGKLILLPVGREYNMVFQTAGVNYRCSARVIDRYKSENAYLILMEITSGLKKQQRRQYYRYSCILDLTSRALSPEEQEQLEKDSSIVYDEDLPEEDGTAIDISGGGMRFTSTAGYDKDSIILCRFTLNTRDGVKNFEVLALVINAKRLERKGVNEFRVEFYKLGSDLREGIIKYIFDEERKKRRIETKSY